MLYEIKSFLKFIEKCSFGLFYYLILEIGQYLQEAKDWRADAAFLAGQDDVRVHVYAVAADRVFENYFIGF